MARQSSGRSKRRQIIDRGGAASPRGVYEAPALEKAIDILELLADNPAGASVNDIAGGLGRSVSEIFRIIIVLERRGFLQKSAETDRYSVAYKILDLAYRATPAQDVVRAAIPVMPSLARGLGQSCHLVVPNDDRGLVIAREENPGVRGFALRLGAPIDLIQSCSGHVILAFSEAPQRERLLARAIRSGRRQVNRERLESELHQVRKLGFDRRTSAITHGVTDISCPVFGFNGKLVAALTVPFLELIDGSQKVPLTGATPHVAAAAAAISRALGHRAA